MRLLDDIISERQDMYQQPYFAMHPDNMFGFNKKIYKGYKVKYYKHLDKEIILFGEMIMA